MQVAKVLNMDEIEKLIEKIENKKYNLECKKELMEREAIEMALTEKLTKKYHVKITLNFLNENKEEMAALIANNQLKYKIKKGRWVNVDEQIEKIIKQAEEEEFIKDKNKITLIFDEFSILLDVKLNIYDFTNKPFTADYYFHFIEYKKTNKETREEYKRYRATIKEIEKLEMKYRRRLNKDEEYTRINEEIQKLSKILEVFRRQGYILMVS